MYIMEIKNIENIIKIITFQKYKIKLIKVENIQRSK